jgi:ferredoxin/flavodoxin---NADP+ reductase
MSFDTSSAVAAAPSTAPSTTAVGRVAIIGCGPSGCYTALALRRLAPDVHITIFDGRPTPFGLVRYGVAPDHQGMKNVSRQFDRLFASDHVEFVGNTVVGEDVQISALEENFDVVVVATGLPDDRPLAAPVDPQARVLGAGQLLRLLNGDPDSTLRNSEPLAPLGTDILIVGAGNVAMDVARLLCKTDEAFHGSDVDDEAREALQTSALRRLTLLARGPRERVRWDASMFAELCALPGVSVFMDGEMVERSASADGELPNRLVRVDVRFNEAPVGIDTDGDRCVVRTQSNLQREGAERGSGHDDFAHRVDTVVTAMGFVEGPDARSWTIEDRVLTVGGCGSGTLGNLADNRALAKTAAQQIIDCLRNSHGRPGLIGVRDLFPSDTTTFDDWASIDRAETARARPDRIRTKFTSWSAMADVVAQHRRTTSGPGGVSAASEH